MGMPGSGQILRGEVEGTYFQQPVCTEIKPDPICIRQGDPAHIRFIAIFLRNDVRYKLLIHGTAVYTHLSALFAVYIGLVWTAPIPGNLFEPSRQVQLQADTG